MKVYSAIFAIVAAFGAWVALAAPAQDDVTTSTINDALVERSAELVSVPAGQIEARNKDETPCIAGNNCAGISPAPEPETSSSPPPPPPAPTSTTEPPPPPPPPSTYTTTHYYTDQWGLTIDSMTFVSPDGSIVWETVKAKRSDAPAPVLLAESLLEREALAVPTTFATAVKREEEEKTPADPRLPKSS